MVTVREERAELRGAVQVERGKEREEVSVSLRGEGGAGAERREFRRLNWNSVWLLLLSA